MAEKKSEPKAKSDKFGGKQAKPFGQKDDAKKSEPKGKK